ncbi:MAG: YggU family protein [Gammaproteobacteria bacterium]|nr:MAG: YggU family protein [Gammaproteobacteria bacterium]
MHVQPRARRDEFLGRHGDRLRVRITAPPIEGRANAHLCAFLAELCDVPKSAVRVEAGQGGRSKRVRIRAPRALPPGIPARET